MCQYNFILTSQSTTKELLEPILSSNGFGYTEVSNKSISGQIDGFDTAIMTTYGHCDCGSILGIDNGRTSQDLNIEKERKHLAKRKWSSAKIERYLADKLNSQARREENTELGSRTEEQRWSAVIKQIAGSGIKFGLFHHQFSGPLENENLLLKEFKRIEVDHLDMQDLRNLADGDLLRITATAMQARKNG